jgi:hypothetical protein
MAVYPIPRAAAKKPQVICFIEPKLMLYRRKIGQIILSKMGAKTKANNGVMLAKISLGMGPKQVFDV